MERSIAQMWNKIGGSGSGGRESDHSSPLMGPRSLMAPRFSTFCLCFNITVGSESSIIMDDYG